MTYRGAYSRNQQGQREQQQISVHENTHYANHQQQQQQQQSWYPPPNMPAEVPVFF